MLCLFVPFFVVVAILYHHNYALFSFLPLTTLLIYSLSMAGDALLPFLLFFSLVQISGFDVAPLR